MNREIKFRAWDGEKLLKDIPIEAVTLGKHLDFYGTSLNVMQFTGLKIGEQEVYEGDVVRYRFRTKDSNDEFVSAVKFDEYMWLTDEHSINRINDVEVIGNIYENPELLN